MAKRIFTSESVTEGHPDKICDQISDGVLDAILEKDPNARVACETITTTGMVFVMGEITTDCYVDIPAIAREVICRIGYDKPEYGFDGNTCSVMTAIDGQSPDIAQGVNHAYDDESETGAGDQGMMFGYACRETENLMPLPIELAHALTKRLAYVREMHILPDILPDGKAQVSVEYDEAGKPVRIDTVVVSTQHTDAISENELHTAIIDEVIARALPADMLDKNTRIFVNPTGRFLIGGPAGDSGLTGRKLIVDTYGGYAHHGGGAFSGKDSSKVDRSAAYMARYLAKNVVAAGLADRCEVQLSYAIGVAQPVSVLVDTFGTEKVDREKIQALVSTVDMRPAAIIKRFDLRSPRFSKVSCYGHFGENAKDMPWEKTDLAEGWKMA